MKRLISWVLLPVCVLTVALVARWWADPPSVDGVAHVAAAADPPAVGDCVRDNLSTPESVTADGLSPVRRVTLVSCDEPHRGEVVMMGPGLTSSGGDAATAVAVAVADLRNRCSSAGSTYLAAFSGRFTSGSGGWTPALGLAPEPLGPDRLQASAGQHWTACILTTLYDDLDAPLHQLLDTAWVPPQLGVCSTGVNDGRDLSTAPCTQAHVAEVLGVRVIRPYDPMTARELRLRCDQLARAAVLRAGVTEEPSLRFETIVEAVDPAGESAKVKLPLPDGSTGYATCAIRTTGDQLLTASLLQLGDAPLPVTG